LDFRVDALKYSVDDFRFDLVEDSISMCTDGICNFLEREYAAFNGLPAPVF
jgi:hypothetical protein